LPHVQVLLNLLLRCPHVTDRTITDLLGRTASATNARRATPGLRTPAALGLALGALAWSSSAAAAPSLPVEAANPVTTVTLVHGDTSIALPASSLGASVVASPNGAVATIAWDRTRLFAQCDALADALDLLPAFEGDVEVDDDTLTPLPPVAGESIDCPALALGVEQRLSAADSAPLKAPITVREPRVSPASVDALAADLRALLEGPVELEITFEDEPAGTITLTPDDVREAVRTRVTGDPPRLEATLLTPLLEHLLSPVLSPLGEPARDADFEISADGSVRVLPSRRGVRVDGAALFAQAATAAKKADKKASVPATKSDPPLTTKKAQNLGVNTMVASFTTKHPCCQPRVTNIHKIATLLDGAIVPSGDRFSLNRHVGKRTTKKGFVLAPSIGEGEVVETVGGGVSQLTTTFYNAVFDGGYAVVSRKPHTFYFPRYPMGVEATLSWPRPDFVFRNDSKSGVLIRASFTDDSITIKLYGDNEGRKVKRFVGKTFDPTDPRVDYTPDESLPLDKPKVKDAGTQGFSVKAGRDITFADGTKKHEERKVVYHGHPKLLAAHPCAIPKGEKGHKKKGCPKPGETTDDKDAKDAKDTKSDDKASDSKKADEKADKKKSDDKKADDKKADDKKAEKPADPPKADEKPADTTKAKTAP